MCFKIKEYSPDAVFVSANFSAYASEAREVISAVRKSSDALVVAGGWSVTAEKDNLFNFLEKNNFTLNKNPFSLL
jgi:ribosome-interacting GTPase 1